MKTFLGAIALFMAYHADGASLDRYKTFLNGTQSARAQFEQKVYDRNGTLTQETRGSFVFQRPGRFRPLQTHGEAGEARRRMAA